MIDYNDPEIRGFLLAKRNLGVDQVTREARDRFAPHWNHWSTPEKNAFRREICFRFCSISFAQYAAERLDQLIESRFAYWVFHYDDWGCDARFAELDGVAVPPSDPFWLIYYPPHLPGCRCCVAGTNSPAGVARLGGDLNKPIPTWCIRLW